MSVSLSGRVALDFSGRDVQLSASHQSGHVIAMTCLQINVMLFVVLPAALVVLPIGEARPGPIFPHCSLSRFLFVFVFAHCVRWYINSIGARTPQLYSRVLGRTDVAGWSSDPSGRLVARTALAGEGKLVRLPPVAVPALARPLSASGFGGRCPAPGASASPL